MSAEKLCSVLHSVGYNHSPLDPGSLQWAFQYEETRPLFNWLCENLNGSNCLSASELLQFKRLQAQGNILKGERLYEALRNHQESESSSEISAKERASLIQLRNQIKILELKDDVISKCLSSFEKRSQGREFINSDLRKRFEDAAESLSQKNLMMNAILSELASHVDEILQKHSAHEKSSTLSRSNINLYLEKEEICDKAIEKWFVKQFLEGPSKLVAEENSKNYSRAKLEALTNRFVKGDSHEVFNRNVSELKRLHSLFSEGENQLVESKVKHASELSALSASKNQTLFQNLMSCNDIKVLEKRKQDLKRELYFLNSKERKYRNELIPQLCDDLAELQDTYICEGDYDLKLLRQEYYFHQRKKFTDFLIHQLSRKMFFLNILFREWKQGMQIHSLISLLNEELKMFKENSTMHSQCCTELSKLHKMLLRNPISRSPDPFFKSMSSLLSFYETQGKEQNDGEKLRDSDEEKRHDLLSFYSILNKEVNELNQNANDILPNQFQSSLQKMESMLNDSRPLIFTDSGTIDLSFNNYAEHLRTIEEIGNQFASSVEELSKQKKDKDEILLRRPALENERRLFVDFFCQPETLPDINTNVSASSEKSYDAVDHDQ